MDIVAKIEASIRRELDREHDRDGRALGIPEGVPVVSLTIDAGTLKPEWAGYVLEFLGDAAPDPPKYREYIYVEADGVALRVWRVRVRRDGVQAYLEAHTQPGWAGFTAIDLHNLDPADRAGNSDMLTHGTAILYADVTRSRPMGTGYFTTPDEFHTAYREAVAELTRDNIRPTAPIIADRLAVSKRTYYDYKRKFGPGD